jgi:hypothetical protein
MHNVHPRLEEEVNRHRHSCLLFFGADEKLLSMRDRLLAAELLATGRLRFAGDFPPNPNTL